jgi:DNA ligase-1
MVYETFLKIAQESGEKSQSRKLDLLTSLLHFASPKEARYIVRTVIGELRTGVAEGIIRDAIAKGFLIKPEMNKEEREKIIDLVDNAYNILCDFGEVAEIAEDEGINGLKKVKIIVGRPIKVMLAEKAKNIEDAMKTLGGKVAIEIKYDGMRAQIHKKDNKVWVYTRRLENVTKQFPDLVKYAKENLKCNDCVVEGEVWAVSKKDFSPLPFQVLSQRIHRKYNIEKMAKEIPIQINLFDIMYLNGKMVIDLPLKQRRKLLERILNEIPHKFKLATQIITSDIR